MLIASLLVALSSCTADAGSRLVLASTTSTEDSGLFDVLLPAFEEAHPGVRVRVVAVGSGQALELGRRRDADVLLVHSPADEDAFMAAGFGRARRPIMYNHFLIVGPADDPAEVRTAADAAEAFRGIGHTGAFVSRGDHSGTHARELALWRAAGWHEAPPGAPHRVEAGQGMAETLVIASERAAYTLTDRATWLTLADRLHLAALHDRDADLLNAFSVITVAGARNEAGADAFMSWVTGPVAASLIAAFGVERFGERLFYAGAPDSTPAPQ